jgi:uncharacterized protein (TIGR00730 family)
MIENVCVFCGASSGHDPAFAAAARALGTELARAGRGLVYGGGRVGLMGILADAALAAGGSVIGVIPIAIANKEIAHSGLTDLRVVDSMHTRKALMADLSAAFIALPGGLGTLEELFEVWTWGQLGLHRKPYGLLNVSDFFTPLLTFLDETTALGFIRPEHREMLVVESDPAALLQRLDTYVSPPVPKWLNPSSA